MKWIRNLLLHVDNEMMTLVISNSMLNIESGGIWTHDLGILARRSTNWATDSWWIIISN